MKPTSLKKYRDEEQSHKKWLAAYRRAITKANKLKKNENNCSNSHL